MANRRNKVKKTSKKKKETRPWADLPQEILVIILEKCLAIVDQIRFRAVCKSWHIYSLNNKYQNLPWLCNLSWSKGDSDRLECEIYDPYSRKKFTTSKFVESHRYTRSYSKHVIPIGSKQGWLIGVYGNNHCHCLKWEIFLYNPYRKEFIKLPFIWKYRPCHATFSGNPGYPGSRVFVFLHEEVNPYHNYIASYGLNGDKEHNYIASYGLDGDKEWEKESLDFTFFECCGIEYMNEQLFCLFGDGNMARYSLANRSVTWNHQLAIGWQPSHPQLRLTRGEGNLLVACELGFDELGFYRTECPTFYYDWSSMSWVRSDLQESSAVFISGEVTIFVRQFKDDDDADDGENEKDCKVYFFREFLCKKELSNYSFVVAKINKCTVFIEPPRIN